MAKSFTTDRFNASNRKTKAPARRRAVVRSAIARIDPLEGRRLLTAYYVKADGALDPFANSTTNAITIKAGESVFVSAVKKDVTPTFDPMRSNFTWDFGDTANTNTHLSGFNYDDNLATGWNAAHRYETAGEYTMTHTVRYTDTGGNPATQTYTQKVVVQPRVYTGTTKNVTRVYVTTDAETTSNGADGATESTAMNLRRLEQYLGAPTTVKQDHEFLFLPGTTYEIGKTGGPFANGMSLSGWKNTVLGTTPAGASGSTRPLIKWGRTRAAGASYFQIQLGNTNDVTIRDLQFSGFDNADTDWKKNNVTAITASNGRRVSVNNVRFRDVDTGVTTEFGVSGLHMQDVQAASDNTAKNDLRAYLLWMNGDYMSVQGSLAENSTVEHIIRGGGFAVNIEHNQLQEGSDPDYVVSPTDRDFNKSVLNFQGTRYAYVSRNRLIGANGVGPLTGGTGIVGVGPVRNTVYEGNYITGYVKAQHGTEDLDIRQNKIEVDGNGFTGSGGAITLDAHSSGIVVDGYLNSATLNDGNGQPLPPKNYELGTKNVRVLYNTVEVLELGTYGNLGAIRIEGGSDHELSTVPNAGHELAGNLVRYPTAPAAGDVAYRFAPVFGDRIYGGVANSTRPEDWADLPASTQTFIDRTFKDGSVGQNFLVGGGTQVKFYSYYNGGSFSETDQTVGAFNTKAAAAGVALAGAAGTNAVASWSFDADGAPIDTAAQAGIGFARTPLDGRRTSPAARPATGGNWTIGAFQRNTTGIVAASVFHDLDEDGVKDTGEPGLRNRQVYLDLDNDSTLDSGEPVLLTSSTGDVQFSGVAAGNYTVRQVSPTSEWAQSLPNSGGVSVTVTGGGTANATFGSKQLELQHTPTQTGELGGTIIGTKGSYNDNVSLTRTAPFSGDPLRVFDAPTSSGAWVGLDLGSAKQITKIAYRPRDGWAGRMLGGRFEGSDNKEFSGTPTLLHEVTSTPPTGQLTEATITVPGTFRYVRYVGPTGGFANVADIDFFGHTPTTGTPTVTVGATRDAYVQDDSLAGTNFGTATDLLVKNSGGTGSNRRAYLDLDLSQLNVNTLGISTLRLRANLTSTGSSGLVLEAHAVDTAWAEGTINWNNAPTYASAVGASVTITTTSAEWYEMDVTSLVRAALQANKTSLQIALVSPAASSPAIRIDSRELAGNGPQLVSTLASVTQGAAQDAYVQDGSTAGTNYGTAGDLLVKDSGGAGSTANRRAFIDFDLTNASSALNSATLRLYGNLTNAEPGGVPIDVRAVTGSWTESTINWSNQPTYASTAATSIVATSTTSQWYEVDVTDLVRAALAANQTTLRLALVAPGTTPNFAAVRFDSGEQANGPQLVTRYTRVATDRIEAESADDSTGVVRQAVPGGGQAIGSFDGGDTMKFANVDFGAGVTGLTARVAQSQTANRFFKLYVDGLPGAGGTLVGTFQLNSTGGWNTYQTQSWTLSSALSGRHDLYVVGDQTFTGVGNVDWIQFTA